MTLTHDAASTLPDPAEEAPARCQRPADAAQGYQWLLEEAVLANSSVDIPAMEAAYVALMDAPAAPCGAAGAGRPADSAEKPTVEAEELPSLASFRELISRLTEQQRSIATLKQQARSQNTVLAPDPAIYVNLT